SRSAREKIEQAGGSITWLRGEPDPRKPKHKPRAEIPQAEPEPPETEEEAAESPESDEPEAAEESGE
ncbi:MAG TPA: uL15m family ribosomal protein, partial [Gaiellaceae bacterium]|nr:uL15m family ribosomal protein [Gaiellaceae bacterium]